MGNKTFIAIKAEGFELRPGDIRAVRDSQVLQLSIGTLGQ